MASMLKWFVMGVLLVLPMSAALAGEHDMVVDLKQFARALRDRKIPALDVKDEVFEDETHDSVFPTALSRGIRFTFGGD